MSERAFDVKQKFHGDIRQGFVYNRVPHVTLGSISRNIEIDVIWEKWQKILVPLCGQLNEKLDKAWKHWEIPPLDEADEKWPEAIRSIHKEWWEARIAMQQEIDQSISKNADFEYLHDQPCIDKSKTRVTGPFTVESLSEERFVPLDHQGDLIQDGTTGSEFKPPLPKSSSEQDFATVILKHLSAAGVHQAHKEDRIKFNPVQPFPGKHIAEEGFYIEGHTENAHEKRAAILIGPEFGTLSRPDIVAAAKEAAESDFDVLVTCAFNYDAHSSALRRLAKIPILQAGINPEVHTGELKNFKLRKSLRHPRRPDIDFLPTEDGQFQVKINGVDVFRPSMGEVISGDTDDIAAWFIDTDYKRRGLLYSPRVLSGRQ